MWTSASSCVVPKLILQPLVENAIIHGVADSDEGFIKLWAEEDAEGYLLLKVSDNGSGIRRRCSNGSTAMSLFPAAIWA